MNFKEILKNYWDIILVYAIPILWMTFLRLFTDIEGLSAIGHLGITLILSMVFFVITIVRSIMMKKPMRILWVSPIIILILIIVIRNIVGI